jgi:hypothetical protein
MKARPRLTDGLAFLFKEEAGAEQFVRSLDTVSKRCWKTL